jgi:ABC-type amino acid transport substrate-binding protein
MRVVCPDPEAGTDIRRDPNKMAKSRTNETVRGETPIPEETATAILRNLATTFQDALVLRPHSEESLSTAASAVHYLQEQVGWSDRELAKWSGIPQPQLSRWLRGRQYVLGEDELARIAWAFAGRLDNLGPFTRSPTSASGQQQKVGRSKLDFLLNLLLALDGYSSGVRLENAVWRASFEPEEGRAALRIGWFPWEPLARDRKEFQGFARDITDYVCKLLGHPTWSPVQLNFRTVEHALRARLIDFTAPLLMTFPGRYTSYRFSDAIPLVDVGLCAVVAREHLERITIDGTHRDLREDQIELVLPPGEVAESMADLVFGATLRAPSTLYEDLDAPESLGHGYTLIQKIKAEPLGPTGRARVVVTSRPTAYWAKKEFGQYFEILEPPELLSFRFRVAFAVHPDEPRLLLALDQAIRVLTDCDKFVSLRAKYSDELINGGITDPNRPPSVGTK